MFQEPAGFSYFNTEIKEEGSFDVFGLCFSGRTHNLDPSASTLTNLNWPPTVCVILLLISKSDIVAQLVTG